jgi:tRNA-dihydrouridine synthase 1
MSPEKMAERGEVDFYRDVLGSPRLVVAPMVDASELAWRMLSKGFQLKGQ